jgi:hypothetical protein
MGIVFEAPSSATGTYEAMLARPRFTTNTTQATACPARANNRHNLDDCIRTKLWPTN